MPILLPKFLSIWVSTSIYKPEKEELIYTAKVFIQMRIMTLIKNVPQK
jgi:hypothetical protein